MNNKRFQGDPAIKITENGARMTFIDGQPVMDQGLENAVQIALFTKKNWWGNVLITNPNQKIGSNFERQRTIIDAETVNEVFDDATQALKPLIDSGLIISADIEVTNPVLNHIYVYLTIKPHARDEIELLFIKNGVNWISQAQNPAHERLL